jgi:hypothetical protein
MATLEAHGQLVSLDGFESGLKTFGPAHMRSQNRRESRFADSGARRSGSTSNPPKPADGIRGRVAFGFGRSHKQVL